MRGLRVCVLLGLAACGPAPGLEGTEPPIVVPVTAQQAYFTAFPERLFRAAAAVCSDPRQTLSQPSANTVRCESLPDPESAAALILRFGGTVAELPTFIIQFQGRDTTQGYLVTADNYVRVPQLSGGAREIRFPDPVVQSDLADLLRAAGGEPLPHDHADE